MKKGTPRLALVLVFMTAVVLAGLLCGTVFFADFSPTAGGTSLPYLKTETVVEPDGRETVLYASGDQYFNYLHDAEGNIIVYDERGYLVYATDDGTGRPVPGGLSATREPTVFELLLYNDEKMRYEEVDFKANSDLAVSYPANSSASAQAAPQNVSPSSPVTITNYIIYICFAGESVSAMQTLCNGMENTLNSTDSLQGYYGELSGGALVVSSVSAKNGASVVVYQDTNTRSYYKPRSIANRLGYATESQRGYREGVLLTNAVKASSAYFAASNPDSFDGDGYVDSVTFVVYGASETWNSLLWPHSWNLYDVNDYYYESGLSDIKIFGKTVGDFTMQFTSEISTGVLCHEFGHVLGAPDLYHYQSEDCFPVSVWDLMGYDQDTPQYVTTYVRDKYFGMVGAGQIGTISQTGVYELSPTTDTDAFSSGVFAYVIQGNANEYFMVEYRTNTAASGFDSMLPGSGLIIYRINTTAEEGNRDGVYQSTVYPDEVYVFRPKLTNNALYNGASDEYYRSFYELNYAALSPDNAQFSSVGVPLTASVSAYDKKSIYYTDGSNSGITVTALTQDDSSISFYVSLPSNNAGYASQVNELSVQSAMHFDGQTTVKLAVTDNLDFSLISSISMKITDAALNVLYAGDVRSDLIECRYGSATSPHVGEFVYSFGVKPAKITLTIVTARGTEYSPAPYTVIEDDEITAISATDLKTEYKYGEQLDKSVGALTLSTESGGTKTIPLTREGVTFTAFDPTVFTPQTVTVGYCGLTDTVTLSVSDEPVSLSVSGTKAYLAGQDLRLFVSAHWQGGAVSAVETCTVTYGGVDFSTAGKAVGEYELTVSATVSGAATSPLLSDTFTVSVCNQATSISIFKNATLMEVGNTVTEFTSAPVSVTVNAVDSVLGAIKVTDLCDLDYDPLKVDETQTLTVKYLDINEYRNIRIANYVTGIAYVGADEVRYGADISGSLALVYANGRRETVTLSSGNVSGYDKNSLGIQTVTFSYGGMQTQRQIEVVDYVMSAEFSDISEVALIGDELTEDSYELNYVLAYAGAGTLNVLAADVSGYYTASAGVRTVSAEVYVAGFGTYTHTQTLTVLDWVTKLEPANGISVYNRVYGQSFLLSVTAVYKSGTYRQLSRANYTVEGYDPTETGEQVATVSYVWNENYPAATLEIAVVVTDSVTYLRVNTVDGGAKTTYLYGEALSLAGVSLRALKASGQYVSLIDENGVAAAGVTVGGFSATAVGSQLLTFTYSELTVGYYVTVLAKSNSFILGADMTFDKSKRLVYVDFGTSIDDFLSKITFESREMTASVSSEGVLKTGDSLLVKNGAGQQVDAFTVLVRGDLNGDGLISEADLAIVASYITGQNTTSTLILTADMDGNGAVGINDYLLMRKLILENAV